VIAFGPDERDPAVNRALDAAINAMRLLSTIARGWKFLLLTANYCPTATIEFAGNRATTGMWSGRQVRLLNSQSLGRGTGVIIAGREG